MMSAPTTDLLPEIPAPIKAAIEAKFSKYREKRPHFSVLFAEAGSPPPRVWKTDVDEVMRKVKDARHDYLTEIGYKAIDSLGGPAAAGELRSELLRDVIWAPGGKRGMMQLERISTDEKRHQVLRETATILSEARKAWEPVLKRVEMMSAVVVTREESLAQKAADALASVSPARLAARPKIAQMLTETCQDRLDEWEAAFVPAQAERILSDAKLYEKANAERSQTVEAFADEVAGVSKHAKHSNGWYMARQGADEMKAMIRGYVPVEMAGRAKALAEAKATATHLRAEFLGKMAEKISSAECEDRVSEIVTERERITQGRLAATLRLRLTDGTSFHLVTDSVIKFGPRSRQPFAQYPTRFTQVKLPGMESAAAQVAEADIAAVLRSDATTEEGSAVQRNKNRSVR